MSSISAQLRPLILGHRGASALAPENTLAAFRRAMDDGADGIEFDVRLSRDGVPVVIHDASLKRTALVDRCVSDMTAAELREIDVAASFVAGTGSEFFAGERLSTLEQVLTLFQTNAGALYPELKCEAHEAKDLAAAVVEVIRRAQMNSRVVIESFNLRAIAEVKTLDSELKTAALFEPKLSRPLSLIRRLQMIEIAVESGADEIALHHSLASGRVIEHAKAGKLEVVVWTVDELRWVEHARARGIKALIANNPAPMVARRNELVRK